jgi:hypothetical protein
MEAERREERSQRVETPDIDELGLRAKPDPSVTAARVEDEDIRGVDDPSHAVSQVENDAIEPGA